MSESLLVTLDRTIAQAIEAALVNQGFRASGGVFLDRDEPVGENEISGGPVVIVASGDSTESRNEGYDISLFSRELQITCYVPAPPDGPQTFGQAMDPVNQAVRSALFSVTPPGGNPLIPGLGGIVGTAHSPPRREGLWLVADSVYTVTQFTLTAALGQAP